MTVGKEECGSVGVAAAFVDGDGVRKCERERE